MVYKVMQKSSVVTIPLRVFRQALEDGWFRSKSSSGRVSQEVMGIVRFIAR